MNKKRNTLLFILGATVYNLLLLLVFLLAGILLASFILDGKDIGAAGNLIFLLVFLWSVGGSFFVYHKSIKLLSQKIDFEKYFDPIIRPKGRKK